MATKNSSTKAARDAAAAARAEAKAEQKKRERIVQLIGGIAVVAIVGALIAVGITNAGKHAAGIDTKAALPKGANSDTYGLQVGKAWTAPNADSIPKLEIWEDFQCPACKNMEASSGSTITALAKSGKLRLEYRPTIFLDESLAAQNSSNKNPNSSALATNALACAADQGKTIEYHSTVFANQPEEGAGYSTLDLRYFAELTGLSGKKLDNFTDCLANRQYDGWVNNSYAKFNSEGITSTPTGILNGKALDNTVLYDPKKLAKAIADAAK